MQIQLVKENKWYIRLVSPNGQIVMVSESYYSKWNAKRAAKKLARANQFEYIEVR